jgi:uncharacterized BrkB/YihY/UPF0761 family membrane protein
MIPAPSPEGPSRRSLDPTGSAAVLPLLKEAASGWMRDNAMRLSAAVSFYSIVSLAPLLVIALKMVGLVWKHQGLAGVQITRQMTSLMGSQAAEALETMIASGARQGSLQNVLEFGRGREKGGREKGWETYSVGS